MSPQARWNLKRKLYTLQDGRCLACGREMRLIKGATRFSQPPEMATFEDLVPRAQGGRPYAYNRLLTCRECNFRRGTGPFQVGMFVTA